MIYNIDNLNNINESKLDPSDENYIKHVAKGSKHAFSNKVFGGPIDTHHTITIPLEHEDDGTVPHEGVMNHLHSHGYKIKDYKAGIATDKYNRDVKIGRVLEKTKAEDHIKKAFTNDTARAASAVKKKSDLVVRISRHPIHVAAMSTNRGWDSCMNMDDGENKHYIPHDIKQGTHVAYLTHAHDTNIDEPVARIALKPYKGSSGDKILRPELRKEYGTGGSAFAHTVNKWAEEKFPTKSPVYNRNSKLYPDGQSEHVYNRNPEVKDILKGLKSPSHSYNVLKTIPKISNSKTLEELFTHSNSDVISHIASNEHTPQHILNKIAETGTRHNKQTIINNPKASGDVLHKVAVDLGEGYHVHDLVQHDNVQEKTLDHLMKINDSSLENIAHTVARHSHNSGFLDKIAKSPHPTSIHSEIAGNEVTTPETLHHLSKKYSNLENDEHKDIQLDISRNRHTSTETLEHIHKLNQDHITKRIKSGEDLTHTRDYLSSSLIGHLNTTPKIVNDYANHPNVSVMHSIGTSQHVSPENIKKIFHSTEDRYSKDGIIQNPKFPAEELHKIATKDQSFHYEIPKNPNTQTKTLKHIVDSALSPNSNVIPGPILRTTLGHANTTPELLHHIATHPNTDVEGHYDRIAEHEKTRPDTLHHMATRSTYCHWTNRKIAQNPNTPAETLEHIHGKYAKATGSALHILDDLARNPKTPTHIVKHISENAYDNETKQLAKTELEKRPKEAEEPKPNRFVNK